MVSIATRRSIIAGAFSVPLVLFRAQFARAASSALKVEGRQLTYNGAEVRLRGVVIGDLLKSDRPPVDYGQLADNWHANTVRLSVHPGYWKADVEGGKRKVLANVAAARRAGLFVILCWHAIGTPDGLQRAPRAEWKSRADAFDVSFSLATSFWKWAAEQFGRDGAVLFELWNEPVDDIRNPSATPGQWPAYRERWRSLLGQIRPLSTNVVLCTAGRWAYDLRGVKRDLLDDRQVAYAWHVYPGKDGGDRNKWLEKLDGLDLVKPVVVTEWGFCEDCNPRFRGAPDGFGAQFLEGIVEPRGLHWTAYAYGARGQPNMLEKDWATPTKWGAYVRAALGKTQQTFAEKTA
jgi:hypothetical protein